MKRYAIVVERARKNYAGLAGPRDLPGCVAAGPTVEETVRLC